MLHPPRLNTTKTVAVLIASLVLFQAALGARGMVLCQHADGSRQIEAIAEQAACHSDAGRHDNTAAALLSTGHCSDQPLLHPASEFQLTSPDTQRVAGPALLPSPLPWDLSAHGGSAVVKSLSSHKVDFPPAARRHALLISAVVLLV